MNNLRLYLIAVAIWGSTWLAIKFQLGVVPPAVSVVWRFALAALILLSYAGIRGLPLRFSRSQHGWMMLQGLCLYGISYVGVYRAEQDLTSGLVAVLFSLLVLLNIAGARLFFGTSLKPAALLGAAIGLGGVLLIFWPQLTHVEHDGTALRGALIAIGATVFSALGNMVAVRNHKSRLPIIQTNGWAMLYGATGVALYAAITGEPFRFVLSAPYLLSLFYLAVFGSVIAFVAYLTLMSHIGADRAGYTSVAIPVVALLLSTLFEQLRWQGPMLAGVALCIAGNILVLRRDR